MLKRVVRHFAMLLLAGTSVVGAQTTAPADSSTASAESSVTLTGKISDRAGTPLAGVDVMVDSLFHGLSNAAGEFRISGLRPGLLEVSVRRVGYIPLSTIVQADAGLIVQLGIKLFPLLAELDTVVVEGKRVSRALVENGFYQRQKLGMGSFMDPDFLDKHQIRVASLLRNLPSVDVQRTRLGSELALGKNGARRCLMSIFIDGNYFRAGGTMGVDDAINRDDLLAMEVYPRPTDVPTKYLGLSQSSLDCGVIMIWTKPPVPKEKKKG